ncbi:hypothetical protein OAF51_03180 [Akkermansiaceae bacterium]|nr:hypothetical protein [Akkermansiaceae bacterium]MDB4785878.1 hypothetical protein [bacterium]MDA7532315.1 hypothetical protein [Akkermansiaceae bacterium]MDB4481644.1 hypothetical protein [Akkermansiaceae bacterium]MDB4646487.1 hypothetical protein [Akkermansiaceae bacterium]
MQRFFYLGILAVGLVSCSSSTKDTGLESMDQGARMVTIDKEGNNNPFAFKKSDVEQGDSGLITGGKRSQFEQRAGAAYADANSQAPAYLKKSYNRKTWAGPKDYSTGSYKTSGFRKSDQKSGFGNRKASQGNIVASAGEKGFGTGSYRTGSSSESGRKISTGSSSYVDQQARDGWRRLKIIESDEYRSISMGQAKSLLGR